MDFNKIIEELLENGRKCWNQKEWFNQTIDFMIEDIALNTQNGFIEGSFDYNLSFKKIINDTLNNNKVKNPRISNYYKCILVLFEINEHILAEDYLTRLEKSLLSRKTTFSMSLHLFLRAEIYIEKLEYRRGNEYYLLFLRDIYKRATFSERVLLYLEWSNLFIKSKNYDLAEKFISFIFKFIHHKNGTIYVNILNQFFKINKNFSEIAVKYCFEMLTFPKDSLNYNELYIIHLYCGEYYAASKDYDKAIQFFSTANSFLIEKWRQYLEKISSLRDFIPRILYLEIKEKLENKILEVVLDYHLHYNYLINSLKSAYDEVKKLSNKNYDLAFFDTLTGLNNRRYLYQKFDDLVENAIIENVPISCLLIDLDNLKQVNDKYGHNEGDVVLTWVCDLIKGFFKQSDIVIRYGGDEILVILFDVDRRNAKMISEKLRKTVEKKIITHQDKQALKVTISVGVSEANPSELTELNLLDKLITEADKYCYVAKDNGRNRVISQLSDI